MGNLSRSPYKNLSQVIATLAIYQSYSSLQGPWVKTEGLVFPGTAPINKWFILRQKWQFLFSWNLSKIISPRFYRFWRFSKIFQELTDNFKIDNFTWIYQKQFSEFVSTWGSNTILLNMQFQFCLGAESRR